MNILVIGASGRVGSTLVEKLLKEKHQVLGTTREKEQLFRDANYSQINLDLLGDLSKIESTMPDDLDAIYFVAGSGGENLLQVDLHGAVKSIQAAEKKNINRYIMLSTVFANQPEVWAEELPEEMFNYYIAKYYADSWLINNSNLNYTILEASTLTEGEGSGKITVKVEDSGENTIENVADTLLEVLNNPAATKKVITMHDGEKPIREAISAL
jgi:nucleoside-diphosphate-sugar epimerase